jgi:hypothetical protein
MATNGRAVKDSATLCLYYWLPEYWLTQELLIVELYWDDRGIHGSRLAVSRG